MTKLGVRLAIRREGPWCNAYLALEGTMEGANLIGSMLAAPLDANPDLLKRWQDFMADVMARAVQQTFGVKRPRMIRMRAPEPVTVGVTPTSAQLTLLKLPLKGD